MVGTIPEKRNKFISGSSPKQIKVKWEQFNCKKVWILPAPTQLDAGGWDAILNVSIFCLKTNWFRLSQITRIDICQRPIAIFLTSADIPSGKTFTVMFNKVYAGQIVPSNEFKKTRFTSRGFQNTNPMCGRCPGRKETNIHVIFECVAARFILDFAIKN